jgi:pSer/pThr/pTyr-binding forkhead associated (FHA) protein
MPGDKLQLKLVERDGVKVHDLPRMASLLVGRGVDVAVRVTDPRASARHARLHVDGWRVTIEDLESRNGTQVRGQRIPPNEPVTLAIGEAATLGNAVLTVELAAGARPELEMF